MNIVRCVHQIAIVLSLCAATVALADESDPDRDLLLHVTFDGSLDAAHARGSGKAIVSGDRAGEIRLVPGLVGDGVLVGARDAHLRYATEGNLDAQHGSIEFWYRPVNWGPKAPPSDSPDAEGFHFNRWWLSSGNVSIHQRYHAGWLSMPRINFSITHAYEEPDRWRYYVITWDRRVPEATIYTDAYTVRHAPAQGVTSMKFGPTLEIGNAAENGDRVACDRIIDEVRIWNRPLRPEEIARRYRKLIELHTNPEIRIRRTERHVAIDGVLHDEEWADATVIGGLIGAEERSLSPALTRFLVMYDDANLYVGMHSEIPAEARANPAEKLLFGTVKDDATRRDGPVAQDDALKLIIAKPGQAMHYELIANSLGTTYDAIRKTTADADPAWNPDWSSKSVLDADGWHLEAAIPFADLEIDPVPGHVIEMGISRVWKKLRQQVDQWAWGRVHDETSKQAAVRDLGRVVLAGDDNAVVRTTKFNFSPVDRDVIEFAARIENRAATAKKLEVGLRIDREMAPAREIDLAPGEAYEFTSRAQLDQINDSLTFRVTGMTDSSQPDRVAPVYYRQTVPVYSSHGLSIQTRHYPTDRVMTVFWRLAELSAPLKELRSRIAILRESDGQVAIEKRDVAFESVISSTDISTATLDSGRYLVEAEVRHRDKVLAGARIPFDLRTADDFPWFGNQAGISEKVPPPWTPMTVDESADRVAFWGRAFHYEGRLLPGRIVNQGEDMLAGPAQFELTRPDGGRVHFGRGAAQVEWRETSDTKMHSVRRETRGPVTITVDSFTEYDGLVWLDVTVAPAGSGPVTMNELALLLPMKSEWVKLVKPLLFDPSRTGLLPEEGYADRLDCFWTGNEMGGIQLISETTAVWELNRPDRCLDIRRQGGATNVRVRLVDRPYELREPRTFSFGFMVTPVKPMPRGYRRWVLGPTDPARAYKVLGRSDGIYIPLYVQGWSKYYMFDFDGHPLAEHYPEGPYPDKFRSTDVKTDGGVVRKDVCLYVSANRVPADDPIYPHWVHEWVVDSGKPVVINAGSGPRLCPGASSLIDLRAWGMNETMKVLGNRGYYFDVGFPQACNNLHHGCGVVDRHGKVLPTLNLMPIRRFVKRLYTSLKADHPHAMLAYHSSNRTYMPIFSFCDLVLDGESYYGMLNRTDRKSYESFLTLDAFRTLHRGNPMGTVNALLPQFRRRGSLTYEEAAEIHARDGEVRPYNYLIGLILLHDSLLWPSYMWSGSGCYEIYRVLGELKFDERYRYVPYWSQRIVALPEKTVASFYVDAARGRVLMVLMNVNAGEDLRLTVDVDWARLGLDPARTTVRNAMHEEPVALNERGQLEVPAPALTYRLIVLEASGE